MDPQFTLSGKLFLWTGDKASWHFIRIPSEIADTLKAFGTASAGFRSIPVKAVIKEQEWKTSLFPEKEGSMLLPVKKAIRAACKIKVDDEVELTLKLQ